MKQVKVCIPLEIFLLKCTFFFFTETLGGDEGKRSVREALTEKLFAVVSAKRQPPLKFRHIFNHDKEKVRRTTPSYTILVMQGSYKVNLPFEINPIVEINTTPFEAL